MLTRKTLNNSKRIVVKVGSSTITKKEGGINYNRIKTLAKDLSKLRYEGREVILVTSAAISAGMERMGYKERPSTIPEKQAAAAVGQGLLMHAYETSFAAHDQIVAQILLTREDSAKRSRYNNIKNTFNSLFSSGIIPIVNENDVVAVDEIKIGDNDTLSAMVASIVDADLLILLSDIDGLYTGNPSEDSNAKLIYEVPVITEEIEQSAGGAGSSIGTGGMFTKIQAAKIAVNSGIAMVIAAGDEEKVLDKILEGEEIGTLFLSRKNRLQFKKRWIAFGARIKGKLFVDKGCIKAILDGKSSVLPAGVISSEGKYGEGETVSICCGDGKEIARGLTYYSSEDVNKIVGLQSKKIEKILGHKAYDEIIHKDNLVLMSGGK